MIDFIDFGCGEGGSIEYICSKFRGDTYLGIESVKEYADKAKENGYYVLQASILDAKVDELPKCKYVTMLHFLEHLSDLKEIRQAIELASKVATDFIFIKMPYFDSYEYLQERGLKLTWSDWTGHPCCLTSWSLKQIIDGLGLTGHIYFHQPILSSDSDEVIPYDAPTDTLYFKDLKGWDKPIVELDGVYREMVAYIQLRDLDYWDELIKTKL